MKGNFKIWCETNEQRDAVLKKLEKQGVTWASGDKPTEWHGVSCAPMGIEVLGGKRMRECSSEYEYLFDRIEATEIKPEYFFKNDECIVIYRKNNQVIALDKRTGTKGVAKCNPVDEFDFNIGAKLAFERLLSADEPKFYNGKICITKPTTAMTVGKIYEVKDGYFQNNLGYTFPLNGPVDTLETLEEYLGDVFVEVVE